MLLAEIQSQSFNIRSFSSDVLTPRFTSRARIGSAKITSTRKRMEGRKTANHRLPFKFLHPLNRGGLRPWKTFHLPKFFPLLVDQLLEHGFLTWHHKPPEKKIPDEVSGAKCEAKSAG